MTLTLNEVLNPMHPELAKINTRFEMMQDYLFPTAEVIEKLPEAGEEARVEHKRLINLYRTEYEILVYRVPEIAKGMEAHEIVEAYTEACRMLQIGLGGFMAHNFSDAYYGVMVNAIYANHKHTEWLFLQVIANKCAEQIDPLIEFALGKEHLHEKALSIIHQLKLKQFRSEVESLLNSSNERLKIIAQAALDALE
jgi:hypothetical protein